MLALVLLAQLLTQGPWDSPVTPPFSPPEWTQPGSGSRAPFINVKAAPYFAAGDGVTDDTAAIQAALNAAPNGATVVMPAGLFNITGLTISKPVTLVGAGNGRGVNPSSGAGQYGTELVNTSTGTAAITIAPVGSARLSGVILKDFSVKGNRDVGGATAGDGIALISGSGSIESFKCYDVTSWRAFRDSWRIDGTVFLSDWYGCLGEEGGQHGLDLASGNPSQLRFFGGSFSYNVGDGVLQAAGSGTSLSSTTVAGNAKGIVVTAGAFKTNGLIDIEANTTSGVEVSSSGNELLGLNITSPGVNSFVGINVKSGSGRNRYNAIFGTFGTSPTHIKVDAGATGPQFFETAVDPNTLTVTAQGVEVFTSSAFFQNIDKAGGLIYGATLQPVTDNSFDLGQSAKRIRFAYVNVLTPNQIAWQATLFANLGTPANGTMYYCSDCTIANPCAGGGTGALAKRLAGVWVCN